MVDFIISLENMWANYKEKAKEINTANQAHRRESTMI